MARWRRTGLDHARLRQFQRAPCEPSASNDAIRLEANLPDSELSGSAIAANALILLRRSAGTDGLKLTATGNLSRALVEEMCGIMEWPGYNKDELFGFHKVINEPDFLPCISFAS